MTTPTPPSRNYEGTKAVAEDVIREDIKACMKGLCHPNLEWSQAVRLAADFLALYALSESVPTQKQLDAAALAICDLYRGDGGWCGLEAAREQVRVMLTAMEGAK